MIERLETVLAKLDNLSEDQQDAIASLIIEELEDEERWDQSFARSQDVLARMAEKALEDDRAGKTQQMDWDKL